MEPTESRILRSDGGALALRSLRLSRDRITTSWDVTARSLDPFRSKLTGCSMALSRLLLDILFLASSNEKKGDL